MDETRRRFGNGFRSPTPPFWGLGVPSAFKVAEAEIGLVAEPFLEWVSAVRVKPLHGSPESDTQFLDEVVFVVSEREQFLHAMPSFLQFGSHELFVMGCPIVHAGSPLAFRRMVWMVLSASWMLMFHELATATMFASSRA